MRKLIYLFAISLCLSSCYTTKITPISQVMNTFIGMSEHDLIIKMGPASKTSSDGAGGRVLSYTTSSSTIITAPVYGYNAIASNTYDNSTYSEFYIDKNDRVYTWRTNIPDIKTQIKNDDDPVLTVVLILGLVLLGVVLIQ